MNNLIELDLGAEGRHFVAEELAGGLTLSRLLLECVDLASGRTSTHLPPETSPAGALEFKYGGKLPSPPKETWRKIEGGWMSPTPTTRGHLSVLISESLRVPEQVCILEDFDASRDDPWLKRFEGNTVFFGQEVFHLVQGPASSESVDEAVKSAQSLVSFVGAVTALGAEQALPANRGELSLDLLRSLARQTRWIFCGAYDGEGYVIWRRRSSADTGQSPGPSQGGDTAA